MKKSLNIFVFAVFAFAVIILTVQACGPKTSNTETTEGTTVPAVAVADKASTLAEKRAKIAKQKAAQEAKRQAAYAAWSKSHVTYIDAEGNTVYSIAETAPSYVGGEVAMDKFLKDNVRYSEEAKENGDEGTVFVEFIVEANGTVREVVATDEVGQNMDQGLRDEAVRVVSSMPKWNPGIQHGKPVPVKFSIPVTFQLD